MLDYNVCCDMLNLSMLVYDYNKKFIIDKKNNLLIKDDMNDLHQDILSETIKNYLQDTEIYKFYNIKKTDLQVGITINKRLKRISIIFRGSESKKDWYYDLQIRKDKLDNGVELTLEELTSIKNYEHYQISVLSKEMSDDEFNKKYQQLQVLANLGSFDEFLKEKYSA